MTDKFQAIKMFK